MSAFSFISRGWTITIYGYMNLMNWKKLLYKVKNMQGSSYQWLHCVGITRADSWSCREATPHMHATTLASTQTSSFFALVS